MIISPPTSDSTSQWAYSALLELERIIKSQQEQIDALKKAIENSGQ